MCDDILKELGHATLATMKETVVQVEGGVVALHEAEDEGMIEETVMIAMVRLPRVVAGTGAVQPLAHHAGHPLRPVMSMVSHTRYRCRRSLTLVIPDIGPPQPRPRSSLRDTVPQAGPSNHTSSSRLPKCDCGISASKKRVVQKSAREGRQFYACAQDVCGFLKWIEGEHDQEGQGGIGPTPLIPAKRAMGTNYSVSGVHPVAKSRDVNRI